MEQQSIAIEVEGKVSTLADFLAANADDPDVCEWARSAKPGDSFPCFVENRAVAA
jgi:hypothetical protein